MTVPDCKCHGEQMTWNKDRRYTLGGFWRCEAKNRESVRRVRDNSFQYRNLDVMGARRRGATAYHAARRIEVPPRPQLQRFLVSVRARRTGGEIQN